MEIRALTSLVSPSLLVTTLCSSVVLVSPSCAGEDAIDKARRQLRHVEAVAPSLEPTQHFALASHVSPRSLLNNYVRCLVFLFWVLQRSLFSFFFWFMS